MQATERRPLGLSPRARFEAGRLASGDTGLQESDGGAVSSPFALAARAGVDVSLDEMWIALCAPLVDAEPTSCAALLERAPALGGGVRFAFAQGAAAAHVRADVLLEADAMALDDASLALVRDAIAAVATAARSMSATWVPGDRGPAISGASSDASASAHSGDSSDTSQGASEPTVEARTRALEEQLDQLTWRYDARRDGSFNVDLDVGDRFAQANVAVDGERLVARVALPRPTTSASREAVALLLLRCAARVRMVGCAFDESGVPLLEVGMPLGAAESQLGHALAALSVAMRRAGHEAALLARDPVLAESFLTFGGLTSGAVVFDHVTPEEGMEETE